MAGLDAWAASPSARRCLLSPPICSSPVLHIVIHAHVVIHRIAGTTGCHSCTLTRTGGVENTRKTAHINL
jgi:hypothetical protein